MSASGDAQARTLDDARVKFFEALAAIDGARGTAERLNEAHLLPEDLFYEAAEALTGVADVLTDLVRAVES